MHEYNLHSYKGFNNPVVLICLILLVVLSVVLITINLTKLNYKCNKEKIVYRYVPKKMIEQQFNDNMPSEIFNSMFTDASPWIQSSSEKDHNKEEAVNKYFISQI